METDPTVTWPLYPKSIPLKPLGDNAYHTNSQHLWMELCLKIQKFPTFLFLDFLIQLLNGPEPKPSSPYLWEMSWKGFKIELIRTIFVFVKRTFECGFASGDGRKDGYYRLSQSGPLCNVVEISLAPPVLFVLADIFQEQGLSLWNGDFKPSEYGPPRSFEGFRASIACVCLCLFSRFCLATCLEFDTHVDEYLESATQLERQDGCLESTAQPETQDTLQVDLFRFQAKYRPDVEAFDPRVRKQIAVIKKAGDNPDLLVVADIFESNCCFSSCIKPNWKKQIYCSSIYMAMTMHIFGLYNAELWLLNHTFRAVEEIKWLYSPRDFELKGQLLTGILACQQRAKHLADQTLAAAIHHRNSNEPDQGPSIDRVTVETPLLKKATEWTYDDTIDAWVLMTPQEAAVRSRVKQPCQVQGQSSPLAASQQKNSDGDQHVYVEIPMLIEDDKLRPNPSRGDASDSGSDVGSGSSGRGRDLSFNVLRNVRKTRSFSETGIGDSSSPLSKRRLFQKANPNAKSKAKGRETPEQREGEKTEEEEYDDLDLFRARTPPPKRMSTLVQRFDVKQEELMRRSASGSKSGNGSTFRLTVEAASATTTTARLRSDHRSMTRSNSFPLAFGEPHPSIAGRFDLHRGERHHGTSLLPTSPQVAAEQTQTHAQARSNSRITGQREPRHGRQHGRSSPHPPSDLDLNENNDNDEHGADSDWIESESEDLPTTTTEPNTSKTYNLRSNPQPSASRSVAVDQTQLNDEEEQQHETFTETNYTKPNNDHVRDTNNDDGIAVVIELEARYQKRPRTAL